MTSERSRKRSKVIALLVVAAAIVGWLLRERVSVNIDDGKHIVYHRGLGLSDANSLFGTIKTRVVTKLESGDTRIGWYRADNAIDFSVYNKQLLVVQGCSGLIQDTVLVPNFNLKGGYVFDARSYDEQGTLTGIVKNGNGKLLFSSQQGTVVDQIYRDGESVEVSVLNR